MKTRAAASLQIYPPQMNNEGTCSVSSSYSFPPHAPGTIQLVLVSRSEPPLPRRGGGCRGSAARCGQLPGWAGSWTGSTASWPRPLPSRTPCVPTPASTPAQETRTPTTPSASRRWTSRRRPRWSAWPRLQSHTQHHHQLRHLQPQRQCPHPHRNLTQ